MGIERRVEKSRMERTERKKEHGKEQQEQITTDFEILDWINIEKRGEIKNRVRYSSCLHNQQDLRWGNTWRDTSEWPQEPQEFT